MRVRLLLASDSKLKWHLLLNIRGKWGSGGSGACNDAKVMVQPVSDEGHSVKSPYTRMEKAKKEEKEKSILTLVSIA